MPKEHTTFIYPVILAGGSGTRLWPRSREKNPKQFMSLSGGRSLFQETCLRFSNSLLFGHITVVVHEDHRFLARTQLINIGIRNADIVTEPIAKNTLAACLSAANIVEKKVGNVPLLFSPADHVINKTENLFESIENALSYVLDNNICIFGITPSSPHTGYGYITKGDHLSKTVYKPSLFTEKPNQEQASSLIARGALWNSGLYFCTASGLKKEASLYTKETKEVIQKHVTVLEKNTHGFYTIPHSAYESIPSVSIDTSITEHSKHIILAETDIIWNDLGSWKSLHSHFPKDTDGNVLQGDAVTVNTRNSYIESTSHLVTVFGLEDVGVIETDDATLVFSLKDSESIKKIVETLKKEKRSEVETHTKVHRPWGTYHVLAKEHHYQSKKITVLPGSELSLQRHKRRAEHWVVIQGVATVTRNDEIFELKKNESTFLPMGAMHRLENKGGEELHLIEIQTGDYFGEDDIERFEDSYGRK